MPEKKKTNTGIGKTQVGRLDACPGLKVLRVGPSSPLCGYVRSGDHLREINDQPVLDTIDFHYKMSEPELDLLFETKKGEKIVFEFENITIDELGLSFEQGHIRTCNNECVFCFIMQQPKGLRRSLYIMDEDYRYSFTHGNFVTLSNTTDEDIARIIEQRLSPLYISVHSTNDTLRRCMLKNELLAPIIPRIKELTENGITVHTQVVLCPGINDGAELDRTIEELSDLYPGVESLALAPVGLTKYRENLPEISVYSAEAAGEIIDRVEHIRRRMLKEKKTRFVWAADEFYTLAGRTFPSLKSYESLCQFENGIGMCRSFISSFNRKKRSLKMFLERERPDNRKLVGLTGDSAWPWLSGELKPQVRELGIDLDFQQVPNRFWGGTVTISGLLTGSDLLGAAKRLESPNLVTLLPPNCLNNDDLFLDDMTLAEFRSNLNCRVVVGSYDLVETLKEALSDRETPSHGASRRYVALTESIH